jgi:hypothetical protein
VRFAICHNVHKVLSREQKLPHICQLRFVKAAFSELQLWRLLTLFFLVSAWHSEAAHQ